MYVVGCVGAIRASHAGFVSEFDPNMSIAQAAARRDFTMNAISMDTNGQIHDPFNGAADIRAGVIRHTSAAFSEDPVRVIRGIRFASRFGFRMARETAKVCGAIRSEFGDIDGNRMWKEWRKWAETARVPSKGMAVMYASGWIWEWPEIAAMVGVPQNP
jgi:tRNA nucleotidyltransferase (CCA-adding enzyme)